MLVDSSYKPYLLEVNCSPSFRTNSKLDYIIKKNVIGDALWLLNFNHERKQEFIDQMEEKKEERMKTGKINKLTPAQREALK